MVSWVFVEWVKHLRGHARWRVQCLSFAGAQG